MSEPDLKRIEVLTEVPAGRRTVTSAAKVLAVSVRQIHLLLIRYRDEGGGAIIHKARGRASNHRVNTGIREYALELVRTRYFDFAPTLATEVLLGKARHQGGPVPSMLQSVLHYGDGLKMTALSRCWHRHRDLID